MEEQKTSTASIALKWGAISGIISFIVTVVSNSLGFSQNTIFTSFVFIFSILLTVITLVLAMKEFRKQSNGFMGFGQGISIGSLTGAIWGLVSGGLNFIYTKFIDNTAAQQALAKAREDLESKGTMSDEQIEQAIKISSMFTNPGVAFVLSVIIGVLVGLVCSLVISAVLKKEKSIFE
jgi:hypothetical protein